MIIYNLFISLDTNAAILCVSELVVVFVLSILSLKKKWVTPELLKERKEATIKKAIMDSDK